MVEVKTADGQKKFKKRSSWQDERDGPDERMPLQDEIVDEMQQEIA